MDIPKWLASFIPEDSSDKAGFGPFTISESAAWMEHIFRDYHDRYYKIGPSCGMRLSEIDVRIFKALTIAATLPELDTIEQCHRIAEICFYWPIMHKAGHYLYRRHAQ